MVSSSLMFLCRESMARHRKWEARWRAVTQINGPENSNVQGSRLLVATRLSACKLRRVHPHPRRDGAQP
jgi:hypothetical protein